MDDSGSVISKLKMLGYNICIIHSWYVIYSKIIDGYTMYGIINMSVGNYNTGLCFYDFNAFDNFILCNDDPAISAYYGGTHLFVQGKANSIAGKIKKFSNVLPAYEENIYICGIMVVPKSFKSDNIIHVYIFNAKGKKKLLKIRWTACNAGVKIDKRSGMYYIPYNTDGYTGSNSIVVFDEDLNIIDKSLDLLN